MKKKTKLSGKIHEPKPEPSNVDFASAINKDTNNLVKDVSLWKKNIVPICSTIITFSTLVFTIYQGYKIREHNILSLLPKIQIEYLTTDQDFQITIKNAGIGPAIIDDIVLKKEKQKNYSAKDLTGNFWYSVFEDSRIPDSLFVKNFFHFILTPGSFISSNEKIDFFGIKHDGLSDDDYLKSMNIMSNSIIYVKYHSIYNFSFEGSLVFKPAKILKIKK